MSEPQAAQELQWCARHLLANPMTLEETDRGTFRLIRRHEEALDRWFTQRLGYRLHIAAGTARLYKTTVVAQRRQLLTAGSTRRPFGQREYVLLALVLAAVAAGPRVVSLRDLVERVRTAAADAAFGLSEDYGERRDLVNVVNWLVAQGVVRELHERVGSYVDDQEADALLEIDPDRVALLPLPALARAETAGELIDRSDRRAGARQWMRAFLAE